jgi:hypothetical protein
MINIFLSRKIVIDKTFMKIIDKEINDLNILYMLEIYNNKNMTYDDFIQNHLFFLKHLKMVPFNKINNVETISFKYSQSIN